MSAREDLVGKTCLFYIVEALEMRRINNGDGQIGNLNVPPQATVNNFHYCCTPTPTKPTAMPMKVIIQYVIRHLEPAEQMKTQRCLLQNANAQIASTILKHYTQMAAAKTVDVNIIRRGSRQDSLCIMLCNKESHFSLVIKLRLQFYSLKALFICSISRIISIFH